MNSIEIILVVSLFIIFSAGVYFIFIKPHNNWVKFIISNKYIEQKKIDDDLKSKIEKFFNVLKFRSVYKKNEDDECTSWIVEIDDGNDSTPVSPLIILLFENKHFPNLFLSNSKYDTNKLPNYWKVVYEKSIKDFFPNTSLKLIDDGGGKIGLPNFAVFAESEEKISDFFSVNIKGVINEWPEKILEQIYIFDNLVIVSPKWSKSVQDWESHLDSKNKLKKIINMKL